MRLLPFVMVVLRGFGLYHFFIVNYIMSLKGNLNTLDLSSIFQLLDSDKKTGILEVKGFDKTVLVTIKEGNIVSASNQSHNNRLGYLLRSRKVITNDQLQACLKISEEKKLSLGKVLVEAKLISVKILREFVREQAENTIYDLFLWKEGVFEYRDHKINSKQIVIDSLGTMQLILEATRRIDEMDVLREQISGNDIVFEKTRDSESREPELNDLEQSVLLIINGRYRVAELVEQTGYEEYDIYKILISLIAIGCIEQCESDSAQKSLEIAAEVLNCVRESSGENSELEEKETNLDVEFDKIGYFWIREKRLIVIAASIIILLIVGVVSVLSVKYFKTKSVDSGYRNLIIQAGNLQTFKEQKKLFRTYLKVNKQNKYFKDIKGRLTKIHKQIQGRDLELVLRNISMLRQNNDYAGIKTSFQQFIDKHPGSSNTVELRKKLVNIKAEFEEKGFESLKKIAQDDYGAIISACDIYLKKHPESKHRQEVVTIISNAVDEYCALLKNEIEAGVSSAIDKSVFEQHKVKVLSILKDIILPDEEKQIKKKISEGNKELKKQNYEKAIVSFEQALLIVKDSRLKDFQVYKSYENQILARLNNENFRYFKKGYKRFDGKWYEPQEYEAILLKNGYVKDEDKWYSPSDYEDLMIIRGYYKDNNQYYTREQFIKYTIKPVLKSEFKFDNSIKFNKINIRIKGAYGDALAYEISAETVSFLEEFKVVDTVKIDGIFNRQTDKWRFTNPEKDSVLVKY